MRRMLSEYRIQLRATHLSICVSSLGQAIEDYSPTPHSLQKLKFNSSCAENLPSISVGYQSIWCIFNEKNKMGKNYLKWL